MDGVTITAICLAYGYFIGSIPTAYLVARFARDIDIRKYGSGNVGASNIGRHLGKNYFTFVAIVDVLIKGSASVLLSKIYGLSLELQSVVLLLAIIGHNWSPYLRFHGGRALSVALGGLLILSWPLLVAVLIITTSGWLISRSVALSFGVALLLLPIWALIIKEPSTIVSFTLVLLGITMLKRVLSNPGTAPADLQWKKKIIPRLLYDRDIINAQDWVSRKPEEEISRGHD